MEALRNDVEAVAEIVTQHVKLCLSTVKLKPYKADRGCSRLSA